MFYRLITKIRQWLVLICSKPYILLVGARRTGKTYCNLRLAVKSVKKGLDVVFFLPTKIMAGYVFDDLMRKLGNGLFFCKSRLQAVYKGKTITFISTDDLRGWFLSQPTLPDVIIVDEVEDMFMTVNDIDQIRVIRNTRFDKVQISGCPRNDMRILYQFNPKAVKVFKWKGWY